MDYCEKKTTGSMFWSQWKESHECKGNESVLIQKEEET